MKKKLFISILNILLFINVNIVAENRVKGKIKLDEKFLGSWSDKKQDIVGFYNADKKIYATSQISKRYRIENIVDGDIKSCWATRINGGIGEQILISSRYWGWKFYPKYRFFHVKGLSIYNGYCKSKELYYKNNRIKILRIDIYRVIVYPIDTDKGFRLYTFNKDINLIYTKRVTLPDKFFYKSEIYFDINLEKDYKKTKHKIGMPIDYLFLLTIEDIYKGTKYNDLCVSEIKFIYK